MRHPGAAVRQHAPVSDPDRPLGKAAAKAMATRAALVELATDLFAERGYVQTSIRDIARAGNLTSGAIYGHFRNKADLLVEAINQRTAIELEAQSTGFEGESDYIEVLTRNARSYRERRRLRALIVQGAAAALTDEETREKLREEQLSHLDAWIAGYTEQRERLGIDPSVDVPTAVLVTWATEVGLGVLEAVGIEPRSPKAWSDIQNRLARSFQLPPDDQERPRPRKARERKTR
jgi:AcrR family transcriptional regulator